MCTGCFWQVLSLIMIWSVAYHTIPGTCVLRFITLESREVSKMCIIQQVQLYVDDSFIHSSSFTLFFDLMMIFSSSRRYVSRGSRE